MLLSKGIDGFLLFKRSEGLSIRTLQEYQTHLNRFCVWSSDPDLFTITTTDILRYLDYYRSEYKPKRFSGEERPIAPVTLRGAWVALHSFWTWAGSNLDTADVMAKIPMPKVQQAAVEPFSRGDVVAMLKVVKPVRAKKPRSGKQYLEMLRDTAIILLLLDTGIRASELCGLTIGDVHLKNKRVSVFGKGAKHRYVSIADVVCKATWQYLAERDDGDNPARPLFLNYLTGGGITRDRLRKRIKFIGDKAGVKNAHPHRFRHTFAIEYIRNGGDLFTLQMMLGHSSLTMVRYYAQLAQADVAKAHAKASPADRWIRRS